MSNSSSQPALASDSYRSPLPNVMGAGGLDAVARSGLPFRGKRVVIAGTGPLLLAVAAHLVLAICEQAPLSRLAAFGGSLITQPAKLAQALQLRASLRQARFYTGCWIVEAKGSGTLESVTLRQNGNQWDVPFDYPSCGYHLVSNLELPRLLSCRVRGGFVEVDLCQQTSIHGVYCAGEPTGIGSVELAINEGQIAGFPATGRSNEAQDLMKAGGGRFVNALAKSFALDPHLRGALVQESSTDVRRVTGIRALIADRIRIVVGVDDSIVEAIAAGAVGWVAGLVNAFPTESVALFDYASAGKHEEALTLYQRFLALLRMDTVPKFVQIIHQVQQDTGTGNARVRAPRCEVVGNELKKRAQSSTMRSSTGLRFAARSFPKFEQRAVVLAHLLLFTGENPLRVCRSSG